VRAAAAPRCPTLANLKALTNQQAHTIYKALYWIPIHGDDIALQDLAEIIFDFYVNAGNGAIVLLQNVLKSFAMQQHLVVDGRFGAATLSAVKSVNQTELYRRYKLGRVAYYKSLVAKHPDKKLFLKGWLNRVNSFPNL